jgi:CheY-like chemotaxis protein
MSDTKVVLVADDDPTLRKAMSHKIKSAGYEVIEAADGEETINLALEKHPDLLVVDQLMPKFTGLAAVKRIRADFEWGRHVPVIVMTNVAEGTSAHRELILVANRYFVKANTSLDELLKTSRQLLGDEESSE